MITATPAAGCRISTVTPYEVIAGSATVSQSQSGNIFTVTATENCTVRINFEEIPTYTVTIIAPTGGTLVVKNGDDVVTSGDKFIAGTVLSVTATPSDDYNFVNWKAVDASTHTYTAATSYTMTEHDVTLSATFAAKVYHNAIFKKNGGETHATVSTEEGKAIVFPATNPAAVDGKVFVGWVAATITGTTDEAPTFVTSATMGDEDVTYYACYADVTPGSSTTKTDELTKTTTGVTGTSYSGWSGKTIVSGAVYAGNSAAGNNAIQLRSKENSGIVSTASGGQAKKVTVVWNSNTATGRTLDVYGKNTAYSSASNLYSSESATLGTKIGSIVYETSTELNIVGDYTYIGIRSNDGAMYLDEIDVDWVTGTPDTYSGYCTTVAADTREAVNITSFTATETTLIKGNTTNTTVANDQAGWTAAYTYASDNTDVATVAADGVITAVGKGTVNITATLNVDKDDANYKKGETFSKSIEITVNNPSHTVAFYDNGTKISEESVEEETAIVFPTNPTPAVGGFMFEGWASAAIDGTAVDKPATVTEANMGDADINYYAVYSDVLKKHVSATFDASDISNLTSTGTRTWQDNDTEIELEISAGKHYTSKTPNTWTVTDGTSNYFEISTTGVLTSVVATLSESTYMINSVSVGTLATDGTTQTITGLNNVSSIRCYATENDQIRATRIVVKAILDETKGYVTTLPTNTSIAISDAGWATYCSNHPLDFTDVTSLTAYTATVEGNTVKFTKVTGKVPANTGLLVSGETASVPVCASAEPVANIMEGVTTETVKDANTIFVLKTGDRGLGFYKNTNDFTVRANSAYIPATSIPSGTNARGFISLDDEATGIKNLTPALSEGEGAIYTLDGCKVAIAPLGMGKNVQLKKGVYVVNGKKVIIK
ncbi:Ig-like domain-containing protein [Prevotella sp. E13-17]|uniref:Ig-like domain-containing protein n=1 Tax=Prevotella sp. E13-17 TaxID=2913616 RepID=UPI001EDC8959|nr:Ig-like domain-containing protein [Prevotella sp. E13-17]UKK50711.1 Ig-like domain-containing protein [Prevotella sp. E13-17]